MGYRLLDGYGGVVSREHIVCAGNNASGRCLSSLVGSGFVPAFEPGPD